MTFNPFQTALNALVRSSNNCIIYVIFKYLLKSSYKPALLLNEGQYSNVLFNVINSVRESRVVRKNWDLIPSSRIDILESN